MIDIQFKFPDWARAVTDAEAELNLFQAAMVQTNRGMLFDQEGGYNGRRRWKRLVLREGQILSQRGALRKSIAPYNPNGTPGPDGVVRFAGDQIFVGTRLAYARMMNDGTTKMPGGVLRPKKAKALKIPLPAGKSASQVTREIRETPVRERIVKAEARLARAQERANKGRARFQKSGNINHLDSAHRAETAVVNARIAIRHLEARAAKIGTTGKGGKGFIFVKSVRIPARNFTDWNETDQAELDGALMSKLVEVLNRGR